MKRIFYILFILFFIACLYLGYKFVSNIHMNYFLNKIGMFKKFYPNFKISPNIQVKEKVSPAEFQIKAIENKTNPKKVLEWCCR